MLAIFYSKLTINACNLLCQGPNMLAIIEILFSQDSSSSHRLWDDFRHCKHIYSLLIDIASIFSPFCDQDCKHIWFLSFLSLQTYLVTFIKNIATICGTSHTWSIPHFYLLVRVQLIFPFGFGFPFFRCKIVQLN